MKNSLSLLLIFFCFSTTYAQIGIKANGTAPITSAQLEVQSTTKAFYPPRMTTAQKNAIVSPQEGAIVYDTDLNTLNIYNGTTWGLDLVFPYSVSQNQAANILKIENTNTGNFAALLVKTNSVGLGSAIRGNAENANSTTDTYGVQGENYSNNQYGAGVFGFHSGLGKGVYGLTIDGTGGHFKSFNGYGLKTEGKVRIGGTGVGTITSGKVLKATSVLGDASWSDLLPYSISTGAVSRILDVINTSTTNFSEAFYGESKSIGVHGVSDNNGLTVFSAGIVGENLSTNGLGNGVFGSYDVGTGVLGRSVSKTGVSGQSTTGTGGSFNSISGYSLTTDNGNVGIGTLTPAAKMDIKGSNYLSHFYYSTTEDTYIRGGKAGSKVLINDIAGTGSVGIGLATPNEILDVNGRMRIRHNGITAGLWFCNSTNSLSSIDGSFYGMKQDTETGIYIGNAWRFWVNNTGNATLTSTLTQSSDSRLKKEIHLLNNSLSSIYDINGYHYKWIDQSRGQDLQTGLIAQEVQKIFPELVKTDEKGFLSINYIGLIPHLIEAVKELKMVNEKLNIKNQSLENRLEKIESILMSAKQ